MRVALDATPALGAPTGVGTFVRGAMAGLAGREGVTVVAYGLTGQRRARAAMVRTVPTGVVVGRTFPAAVALSEWSRGHRLPPAEWLAGGRVDVVHGTNFVVPPSRRGAVRVVTVHDLTAVTFPQLCTPTSRRYPELVQRAVEEGAWVHTPSEFVADEIRAWLGTDHVRAVPHGVDPPTTTARPTRRDVRSVLALGTIEPRKDLPLLVRAFDLVADQRDDVRLVIAGGDGWGTEDLARAMASARHGDLINRIGYVDPPTRDRLLAEAAVLAFPSVYEGFGLPVLEAMAAGVPVVATAAGAVPEVVGEAAVIVPVGDEEGLASALTSVLDDVALAARLRVRGRHRAATFTWERCADGLLALYEAAACE